MSLRLQKVAEQLQQEIAKLLLRESKDPRLNAVSITGVRVSPDLQIAHVHYVILGDSLERDRRPTEAALEKARGWLRTEVGRRVRLRRSPELKFHYDDSLQRGEDMERKLAELRAQGEMGDD